MAPIIVFSVLATLVLGSWGWSKYREYQTAKRSEDLRNLYATVHSGITNHASRIAVGGRPPARGDHSSRDA